MHKSSFGFTLIEILIVLAIVSGLIGLSLPNILKIYTSFENDTQRKNIEQEFNGFNQFAYLKQQTIHLETPEDFLNYIPLPNGWGVNILTPITFRYDGVCQGGGFELIKEEILYSYHLTPPFCRPEVKIIKN